MRRTGTEVLQDRVRSAKVNRVSSARPMGQAERIALACQKERFAALLAKLPTPKLP